MCLVEDSDCFSQTFKASDLPLGEESDSSVSLVIPKKVCNAETYSASNWFGSIKSVPCNRFLYAGTTSSLTYKRPWSPITGSSTKNVSLYAVVELAEIDQPQKKDPSLLIPFNLRSLPIDPTASTASALGA